MPRLVSFTEETLVWSQSDCHEQALRKSLFYHIVVIDSRKKRDGRSIERVGFFNPCALGQEETLRIDMERINHWVSLGAQTSDRVTKLINENAKAAA